MREWALGLCRSNEVAFDTFIETSGLRFAYLLKPVVPSAPPPKLPIMSMFWALI